MLQQAKAAKRLQLAERREARKAEAKAARRAERAAERTSRYGNTLADVSAYFLAHPSNTVTLSDLADATGAKLYRIVSAVQKLVKAGEVVRVAYGRYVLKGAEVVTPDRPPVRAVAEPEELRLEILRLLREDGGAWTFRELVDALRQPVEAMATCVLDLRERGLILGEHEGNGPARVRLRRARCRLGDGVRAVGVSTDVLAFGKVKHAACDGAGCSLCLHVGFA